jgi:hypothetical protein
MALRHRLAELPCFADPANLATPEEPKSPVGESAIALLQAVYRDVRQPLSTRIRCAVEALLFENPKHSSRSNAPTRYYVDTTEICWPFTFSQLSLQRQNPTTKRSTRFAQLPTFSRAAHESTLGPRLPFPCSRPFFLFTQRTAHRQAMPVRVCIIVGSWLVLQVPIGMLLGRYLRRVRRSYPRVTDERESCKRQKVAFGPSAPSDIGETEVVAPT